MCGWVRVHRYTMGKQSGNKCQARAAGKEFPWHFDKEEKAFILEGEAWTDGQCSPRHQTHFEPSFLELNGIL